MSSPTDTDAARRSVVPNAAAGSAWLAAVWTGLGAAILCATVAILAVAVCWLPVSGTTGRTNSAIRAGLLSLLASTHGGVTVDGVSAGWLPLGMLMFVGLTAWRAGTGLADAADALGERDPLRLVLVGATQAVSFTVGCLLAVPFATLGTSHAPFLGVGASALVLFALTGGTGFVRSSALREWCDAHRPSWLGLMLRAGAAAVAVYLAAGALLVAGSLVLHHTQVEALSAKVGGGWGSVPILLLGVLAAPNAVIAGSSYLAGPGFAVGTGTTVSVFAAPHGTLPAFPLLAAVPVGHGANPVVWTMVGLTPLLAGVWAARLAARATGLWPRLASAGGAAVFAGLVMLVLGWQAGGSVGDGRLQTVGPSPWKLGCLVAAAVAVVAGASVALAAAWRALRDRAVRDEDEAPLLRRLIMVRTERAGADDDVTEDGELAG